MKFINDSGFQHLFFKDVVRIDYDRDMPPMLINDYGYSYFMFCYGDFIAVDHKGDEVAVPKCLIKGTGDYFNIAAHEGNIWITLELPNHVLHNITKVPAEKSRNVLYDLQDYVDPVICNALYERLREVKDVHEIASIVDEYLEPFYEKWGKPLKSTPIVDFIYKKQGLINLADVMGRVAFSERSLERLFKKEVGSTPYRFIRLVRFNYVIRRFLQRIVLCEDLDKVNTYSREMVVFAAIF